MITADLHCDTVLGMEQGAPIVASARRGERNDGRHDNRRDKRNDSRHDSGCDNAPTGHVDLDRLRRGKVGLQAFAAYVPAETPTDEGFETAEKKLRLIRSLADDYPDAFEVIETAGAARTLAERAPAGEPEGASRVGILLTVENGAAINGDVRLLERLRRLGVRSMTLVHAEHLPWVASCTGSGAHDGLTPLGREIVLEMVRLGMLVDVSHASESAFWEVVKTIEPTGKPFIASHSNAASICPHPRNLTDDQIRAVAEAGGVIGANFYPAFLDRRYHETLQSRKAAGMTAETFAHDMADLAVPRERVVEHIEHIVRLAGWDHIAFGSDFDGIPCTPTGLTGSDDYPALLNDLRSRGHGEHDLRKLAWGNVMRVLEATE